MSFEPTDAVDDTLVVATVANSSTLVKQIHIYQDSLRTVLASDVARFTTTA